jgi:hypothetical protein
VDAEKGEVKAQACDKAWLQQLTSELPVTRERRRANMFITSQKPTSGQCAGVGPGMIFCVAVFRQVDFSGIAPHYATLRE